MIHFSTIKFQSNISVPMACSLGYYIDATTGKSRQCADGTYQPHTSRVNILSYKDGLQSRLYNTKITRHSYFRNNPL